MQKKTTVLVIVLVVLLAVLLLGGFGMMGLGMMAGYGYGFSPLRAILLLAFWALIIGGVTLLAVYFIRNDKSSSASNQAPLDILKTRYARGEITKEQFDAIKRDLGV